MTIREGAHSAPPVPDAAHGGGAAGVVLTLTDGSGAVVATTTTNENGEYRFRGLSDGTYTLTADSPQHDPVTQTVTVSNGTVVTHDLDLGGRCELTGIVRAAVPSTTRTTTHQAAPDAVPATSPTTQLAVDAPPPPPGQTDPSNAAVDVLTTDRGQPAEDAHRPDDDGDQPSRRRRWGRIGLVTVVVVALVAGTGWYAWTNGWLDSLTGATAATPSATGPAATATVEIGTLAATDSWDGTLDHGTPFTVTSSGEGVITRLVDQGATVKRGDELYRVNEQPVTLLYGAVPMYRNLGPGDSGAEVKQLETNLAKLGFDGFTVDKSYTSTTAVAVRAWQQDVGAAQTGMVARGDVVFAPAGGQVDSLRAGLGDTARPGTPVLDITGTDQVVSLEADVDDRDRFEVDTDVTVVLPGGDEITGTVATTAVVEVRAEGTEGEDGEDTESILQVEIAVDKNVPDEFVGATVGVIVAVDERTDVLLVPVNALLALTEGGYGLEVVADDGSTSIVPVETGLFAGGKVEITSGEVAEGAVVGVAGR